MFQTPIRTIWSYIVEGQFAFAFIEIASLMFILFICFPVHESAHAWMASKQGDQTARLKGRLTLNPMAHIDLLGAVMILLVGVGYAKPVPVNPNNLKNGKKSFALIALAGPVSNLILGYLSFVLLRLWMLIPSMNSTVSSIVQTFLVECAMINFSLAVFNLIPIPPLDGSRILTLILPEKHYWKIMQYERYIMLAVFGLCIIGAVGWIMKFPVSGLAQLFNFLAGKPLDPSYIKLITLGL